MTGNKLLKNTATRQLIRIDEQKMSQYHFGFARCDEDYFCALKLVQDAYINEGYVNPDEKFCKYRILENHFYEKTRVFIGKKDEALIFTVSLFPDSPFGLPMDLIYKKELDHMRSLGRKIGEAGCLATHPEFRNGSQNILIYGNKVMLKYAMEYLKLDDLVICVHPKHAQIYKYLMMFDEIGEGKIKVHPKVNGNPAVALRLNLNEAEAKFKHFYQNNPRETNLYNFLFAKQDTPLEFAENNRDLYDNSEPPFVPPGI